jgi:uncharacterized protein
MFVWDEQKRQDNISKHGLDFIDAEKVLTAPHVMVESSYQGEEKRFLAISTIAGRFVTVVYTMRDSDYRIISMRSARDGERKAFEALYC